MLSSQSNADPIVSNQNSSSGCDPFLSADFNGGCETGFVPTVGCGAGTGLLRKAEDPPPKQVAAEALAKHGSEGSKWA